MMYSSNYISSEAAKLCKIRFDKPSHRRYIPTHPISKHTISRMKVLGIHWTINSFARALRRDYIELISMIPRYTKVGLLPRTAAGQPYLPPGLSGTIDLPTKIYTSALIHFYNDFTNCVPTGSPVLQTSGPPPFTSRKTCGVTASAGLSPTLFGFPTITTVDNDQRHWSRPPSVTRTHHPSRAW